MRQLDKIIVHCSDSPDANDTVNAKIIDGWHRKRGFKGIGYHFVILRNGSVEKGRSTEKMGAHVKGQNKHSIGICLVGRVAFAPEQLSSLQALISQIWQAHGQLDVYGHRDFTKSKTCPNFDVKEWLNTWQKQPTKEPVLKASLWSRIIKSLARLIGK